MCGPAALPIAALALTTLGTAFNASTQSRARNAENRTRAEATARSTEAATAERERQRGLEETSFEELSRALSATDDLAQGAPQQAVEQRLQAETAAAAPALTASALPGQISGDTDLSRLIGAEISGKAGKTQKQLKALAALTALGTAFSGNQDTLSGTGSGIQTVNSRRRGSLGVSRLETDVRPATVRASTSPIGDLLSLGGSVLGLGGGGGLGALGAAGGGLNSAQRLGSGPINTRF